MQQVWLLGDRLELHLTGEDTGGNLCVVVDHPSPGFQLVPHRHHNEDETIHIVDGTFEFVLNGETRELRPGDTVHVPRGAVHGIRNAGAVVGHRVLVFHPAGIEGFFLRAGTATAGELRDPQELLALANEHGWEFVASDDH
jgi:quercetin dioxygenase-like cupin family protein